MESIAKIGVWNPATLQTSMEIRTKNEKETDRKAIPKFIKKTTNKSAKMQLKTN